MQRCVEALNDDKKALNGARVIVLGIAYKKNSSDCRESPSLRLLELLANYGAEVSAVDPPHVDASNWPTGVQRVDGTLDELQQADLVVLVTDHDAFDYDEIATSADAGGVKLLDTRNRLPHATAIRL